MIRSFAAGVLAVACLSGSGDALAAKSKCDVCKIVWADSEKRQGEITVSLDYVQCYKEAIKSIDETTDKNATDVRMRQNYAALRLQELTSIEANQKVIKRRLRQIGNCRVCYPPKNQKVIKRRLRQIGTCRVCCPPKKRSNHGL